MMKGFAVLALCLLPSLAFAAGFAKQSLFLSQDSVTEGETVQMHAVVNNDSDTAFAGTMVFSDGEDAIGTTSVSIKARGAGTVSVSWTPEAGAHNVTAELIKGGETVEKRSATFRVAAKPKPATTSTQSTAAAVESSAGIQEKIEDISPAVAGVTAPFFTLVDGGRAKAADIIDAQLSTTKTKLGPEAGKVLGAEETRTASKDPLGALWYVLQTLYFYLLTLLRFLVGNAGIFYPLLAVIFLYTMWKMVRSFRRA